MEICKESFYKVLIFPQEIRRYEKERQANQSTYWVLFELLWRDYFRWVSVRELCVKGRIVPIS